MSGDPKREVRWRDSRYLSEHWGPTMAAQDGFAIDAFRAAVESAVRDLLAAETFGPKALLAAVSTIALDQRAEGYAVARRAREARQFRLKANGGCPACADAVTPDPDNHRKFHEQMTDAPQPLTAPQRGATTTVKPNND